MPPSQIQLMKLNSSPIAVIVKPSDDLDPRSVSIIARWPPWAHRTCVLRRARLYRDDGSRPVSER